MIGRRSFGLGAAALAHIGRNGAAQADGQKVLRVVPQAEPTGGPPETPTC